MYDAVFRDWLRTYAETKAPHVVRYDEATGIAEIYSKASSMVVCKAYFTPEEFRATLELRS
jgi:hypothetical protein